MAEGHAPLQILQLDDPAATPEGWGDVPRPPQIPWTDISVYELHIRDFSAMDESVPEQTRGSYLAFAETRSQVGAKHMKRPPHLLARAGNKPNSGPTVSGFRVSTPADWM